MTLPPLTIPSFSLPFEIPSMIHPAFVHFAIVLPVVILILELINLFVKKRTVGVLSFFFMVLVVLVFFAAYLTGATDDKAAKAFLSPEAKEALAEHKQLGIYLVYASGLLMLFKLFSVMIRKTAIKVLFFLVLIVFTGAVFNEGKKGGALVYQYGVNVKSVPAIGKEPKVKVEIPKTEESNAETKTQEPEAAAPKTEVLEPEIKSEESKVETVTAETTHTKASAQAVEAVTSTPTEEPNTEGNISH